MFNTSPLMRRKINGDVAMISRLCIPYGLFDDRGEYVIIIWPEMQPDIIRCLSIIFQNRFTQYTFMRRTWCVFGLKAGLVSKLYRSQFFSPTGIGRQKIKIIDD
jgi:hypothetical protein